MSRNRAGSGVAALVAAVALIAVGAQAQDGYPRKPITFIIPNEAGSSMDSSGRPLADLMQKELGQPMIIVNKPEIMEEHTNNRLQNLIGWTTSIVLIFLSAVLLYSGIGIG